jgi:hypothetical protein
MARVAPANTAASRGRNPGRILLLVIAGITLVLVVAAVIATRGGAQPSRAEYQTQVVKARDSVSDALAFAAQATTVRQVEARLALSSRVTGKAADDLDKVGAPKGLEEEAAQLVAALRYFSGEIDATEQALKGSRLPLRRMAGLTFKGFTRTQNALRALRAKGIDVPLLVRY